MDRTGREPRPHGRAWFAKGVLAGGLILTALATFLFTNNLNSRLDRRFNADVEAAADTIERRLETCLALLRGGSAYFTAAQQVTRTDWREYIDRLHLPRLCPGVQGIGFSVRMRPEETNQVIQWMQAQGATNFHIWPGGNRPEYHAIVLLEPLDQRNSVAIGYDMWTDPVRRQAMDLAWKTASSVASGKVRLVQDIQPPHQAGFLVYSPVFRASRTPGPSSTNATDLFGFVYAPFRADDFLQALFTKANPLPLQMVVFDSAAKPENLLHRSRMLPANYKPRCESTRAIDVAGRSWILQFASPPEYEATAARMFIPVVALFGLGVTLVLFLLTRALQASEEMHRTVSETATDAILTMDEKSVIRTANRAAEQMFGYSAAEMIGQSMTKLMPERYRKRHRQGVERYLATGERHITWGSIELAALHKDGHEIPVEVSFGASEQRGKTLFTGFLRDISRRKHAESIEANQKVQLGLRADISAALAEPRLDLPGFLQPVAEAIVRRLEAAFARVWTLNPETNVLELQASAGLYTHTNGAHARVPVGKFKIGLIAQEKKPHLTNDVPNDPRVSDRAWARREGMAAFAGYPLLIEDRVLGVIALFSKERLSQDTLAALGSIADLVAHGLERKRIQEERDQLLRREQEALAQSRQLLDSLQRSENQLRLVTDALPVLISYIDREHRYQLANRAYETWFGISRAQILGKTVREVLGADAYAALQPHLEASLQGKDLSLETRIPYRGGDRHIRATYVPHFEGNEVIGLFVMVADITEQKQTEHALTSAREQLAEHAAILERTVAERTAKLKETIGELEAFSYSISHDLRAPLRAMQGFAHVLMDDFADKFGESEIEYLRRIVTASERMDRLIQDVLAYGQVARAELKVKSVDLEKLVTEVIQHYPALQPPAAEIVVERPLLPVIGHDASLTQCLSNLLTNAVKFVPANVAPRIGIRTESVDRNVRLWIEDNGIGIASQHQERIFSMFQRVHSEHEYQGTGIGLAIVKKAVQRMGGEVGVHSEEGKGSRFWIQLRRG